MRSLLAAVALTLPSRASAGSAYDAAADIQTIAVRYVGEEARTLSQMAANPAANDEDIRHKALRDFDKYPEVATVNVGPYAARGWQMPSRKDEDRQGTLDSITKAGKKALLEGGRVPSPLTEAEFMQLVDNTRLGDSLRARGMVSFDSEGFLPESVLGAYIYTKTQAIGVKLNEFLARVARKAGDFVAWTTLMHEYAHAYMDVALARLSPEQAKKGEEYAFAWQAKMWEHADPNGEMISVLYHDLVENGGDPYLAKVVQHNVELRYHAKNGTLSQFVEKLGYKDKHFPHADHDSPGS